MNRKFKNQNADLTLLGDVIDEGIACKSLSEFRNLVYACKTVEEVQAFLYGYKKGLAEKIAQVGIEEQLDFFADYVWAKLAAEGAAEVLAMSSDHLSSPADLSRFENES